MTSFVSRFILGALFVMSPFFAWSQCDVKVSPGSIMVIDHEPGVEFQFDISNESLQPYTGGTLYMAWTLSSSDPIWEFQLTTPIQPGETVTVSTPKLDIPAVWPGELNMFTAPNNQPTANNPWIESNDWFFYTQPFPYPGPLGNGNWVPIRLYLDGCTLFDAEYIIDENGDYYYGPLTSGCLNEEPDQFCDRDCEFDIYDFTPDHFGVTVIGDECFNYNKYPRNQGLGSFVTIFSVGTPIICTGNVNYNNFDTIYAGDSVIFDYYEWATAGAFDCLDQMLEGFESDCKVYLGISNPNILQPPLPYSNYINVTGDPLCLELLNIEGCTDPLAENYDPEATIDDGSCDYYVDLAIDTLLYTLGGCDTSSIWWQPEVLIDNVGDVEITEFCVKLQILGQSDDTLCFDGLSILPGESYSAVFPPSFYEGVVSIHLLDVNGESPNSWDDFGEDDEIANNMAVYIFNMTCLDCTDPEAHNYNEWADQEQVPSNCVYGGCTDPMALNYDPTADVDDGSCEYLGCTDPSADNYDPQATQDDGSCEYLGCTDPAADNYDPNANVDDGSCFISGCTDPDADNYNYAATIDDGSCDYRGCTDPLAWNYDPTATTDDGSCIYAGCMDPTALNYNPNATIDDGSCDYPDPVYDECDDPPFFAPNTFTPNNDGMNDVWYIETNPACWREWNLQIFNRWGELIFETDRPEQVWNGSVNGGEYYVADGVYVYVVVAHYTNKADVLKKNGSITVFR